MGEGPALTLCSHAHLAHSLRAADGEARRAAGAQSWESPPIFALDDWLARQWAACGDRLLLTAAQEALLWHDIIAASAPEPLLDLASTAARAAEAWHLAHAWALPFSGASWDESPETTAFQGWAAEFRRRCDQRQWVTAAQLPAAIAARLRRGPLAPPACVTLAGFDQDGLAPALRDLFAALASAGAEVELPAAPAPRAAQLAAALPNDLVSAAAWARWHLEQGSAGPFGIVVPDLARRRGEIERVLLAALHPDRAPWDPAPRAFHISLGAPLAEAPLVAAALQALELLQAPEPFDLLPVLALLRSPFLAASDTEAAARAQLEQRLRGEHRAVWLWRDLLPPAAEPCPALLRALRQARVLRHPARQTHAAWVATWTDILQALGWPGERPLDSAAWQTFQAWERLLDAVGRFDQVLPAPVAADEALARLRHAAQTAVFQPKDAPAPVRVLGLLEADGVPFQGLWVCGLDDETFPAAPRPNPFLPRELQRAHRLPHATSEVEAAFAQRLWQRLCGGAPEIVAGFARHADDGHDLRPSPLVAGCAPWKQDAQHGPADTKPAPCEVMDDAQAPPTPDSERHGGSSLFRDQSACPFRAFAHRRLRAKGLDAPQPGLTPITRGVLLHAVLRRLWEELGDSAHLVVDDALRTRIAELAGEVVDREPCLHGLPGAKAVERDRLTELVYNWCDQVEKTRPPFRVVAREEHRCEVPFADLTLKLVRDRVDELPDGHRVLLDYKSGETKVDMWKPPYPAEPQLPLYLLTDDDPATVQQVAFAQVRTGDMKLVPLERPKIPELEWRQALEALAGEYIAGYAAVQPRLKDCCKHCDLAALCRIREAIEEPGDGDSD